MALTPSVGTGQIITPTWGNEIRDRSVQVFATKAELDTWSTAPNGAHGHTTDTNLQTTGFDWVRIGGVWRAMPDRGRVNGTAATGRVTWAHRSGGTPTAVFATVLGTIPYSYSIESIDAANVTIGWIGHDGTRPTGAISFLYLAWP